MTTNSIKQRALILTAAGSSVRMGSGIKKEYLPLHEGTVLSSAARVFFSSLSFSVTIITYPFFADKDEDQKAKEASQKALFSDPFVKNANTKFIFISGGKTRQESVLHALQAASDWFLEHNISTQSDESPLVFIHDGARPFITKEIITTVEAAATQFGAAVPGLVPTDTQKEINQHSTITKHLLRSHLIAVQTPQVFRFFPLLSAHQKAAQSVKSFTDDTEIWDEFVTTQNNASTHVVPGNPANFKITYPEDLIRINSFKEQHTMIRTGLGYDKHLLIEERKLILGGVTIPFNKGESGHSDGDVLIHAIIDALLGASGLGDVGSFFPPSDQQWKDADSTTLLSIVWEKITDAGWKLGNIDCVIALEQPKFLPYREQVRNRIAQLLNCSLEQVFVKAKTGEKLGDIGTGRAVESWATCLLEKK